MDNLRSQKLNRLVKVQRHVEKMAENDLALTIRERTSVAENMEKMADFITSLEPMHRAFSRNYTSQYSRLAARDTRLDLIQRAQETQVLKERTKADRLEEKKNDAVQLETRMADDKSVYELIDLHLTLKDVSLQQG
jgi:hypothetical protein